MPRILKGCQLEPAGERRPLLQSKPLPDLGKTTRHWASISLIVANLPGREMTSPSSGSPLPIHGCAPTARTGRRRKRLVFQRWTVPGTARDDAVRRSKIRPSFCTSISAKVQNLELKRCQPAPDRFSAGIPSGCGVGPEANRWCRFAQPPANGCDAFGIRRPSCDVPQHGFVITDFWSP
jgi:hypothetical protein